MKTASEVNEKKLDRNAAEFKRRTLTRFI